MILIGWMMRAIILGAKLDECRACHVPGPHVVLRKTHWFTLFRIPLVLLWVSHGLMCPECGDTESLGWRQVRQALRDERLPLGRSRPAFEASVRQHLGGADPADWETFGLAAGASDEQIRARWRELAKSLHPDAGGQATEFVRVQGVYHRLLAAKEVTVGSLPDATDLFDPVVRNPNRGAFDGYTKVWPFLAAGALAIALVQSPSTSDSGLPSRQAPAGFDGTAHTCWVSSETLNGCQDDYSTLMLFGTKSGTATTCYFVEPLSEGEAASCEQ